MADTITAYKYVAAGKIEEADCTGDLAAILCDTFWLNEDAATIINKCLLRAYQLGLETGIEAKKEFDNI